MSLIEWIPGEDLWLKYQVTTHTLMDLINNNELTAYDSNSHKPIDWKNKERIFLNIREKIKRPTGSTWAGNRPIEWINPVGDEYIQEGCKMQSSRCPWEVLHDLLQRDHINIDIPVSQYNEIIEGWGVTQMAPLAEKAIYRKSEIEELIPPQKEKTQQPAYLNDEGDYYVPEIAALINTWKAVYIDRSLTLSLTDKNEEWRHQIAVHFQTAQKKPFTSEQSKNTDQKALLPKILCGDRHSLLNKLRTKMKNE